MLRKTVLALTVGCLPLATVAATSAASAAARPDSTITFTGKISCSITGVIHSTPGLKWSEAQTVKFTLSASLTKCTGHTSQGGATITRGSAHGAVTGSYSCQSLLSSFPKPSGKITWTTTGNKATPTGFKVTSGSASGFPTVTLTLSQTGSFAGTGNVTGKIKQSESQLLAACNSSTGLTTINISSGTAS